MSSFLELSFVCLFVCGASLTSGQLIIELEKCYVSIHMGIELWIPPVCITMRDMGRGSRYLFSTFIS